MNHRDTPARKSVKLALLAGTCLSTSAPSSQAASYVETTDFPNDLASSLLAPVPFGTDPVCTVTGGVTVITDPADFITFTNLLAGSSFSMEFVCGVNWFNVDSLNSSGIHVGSPAGPVMVTGGTHTYTGTVPIDGRLVAQVGYAEGTPYTINLTGTPVPEPNAAALAALGVTAAALRRNRRSRKDA